MIDQRSRVSARHLAMGLMAVGVAACASILGIDDRSLDTQGDAGADGGGLDGGLDSSSMGDGPGSDATGNDAPGNDGAAGDGPASDAASCPDPCAMATGLNHPFAMTSDSKNVYWTEYGDTLGSGNGAVRGCPVTGCPSSGPVLYGAAMTNPRGIATDGQNVYWATATYGGVNGAIWSCAAGGCGGSPTKLVAATLPFGVAVDANYVYWVENQDTTIHKVAKAGGADNVLWDAAAGGANQAVGCAVDNAFVYMGDYNGDVFRVPIGGGDLATIYSTTFGVSGFWGLAVDSTSVYYTLPGQIVRAAKTATDGGFPIATSIQDPDNIALDPSTGKVYWSDWGSGGVAADGTIGKVTIDGGQQTVISPSLPTPEAVTVSGNELFWLSNGTNPDASGNTKVNSGTLIRVAK